MTAADQASILQQIGRTGWTTTPYAVPDIQYVANPNGYGAPIPQVRGYTLSISDGKGNNQTIKLNHAPGSDQEWAVTDAPTALPKPATATVDHLGDENTGYYARNGPPDANGQPTWQMVVPPHTPNADDEMTKALGRIDRQQEMAEKQANEAAGRGYQTNADYQKMASQYANDQLGQAKLQEDIRQFNATQAQKDKQFDVERAAKDKVDAQNILQSQAQTGLIGANTASVTQATQLAGMKAPGEMAKTAAETEAQQATTAKTLQDIAQGKQPTTVQNTLGTTYGQYAQVDPNTGKVSFTDNPNYQPTTMAQIAARVGQINDLMRQKQAEVQGKVGTNGYTADDALKEFNGWYDQQVAPQQASLQQATQDAELARAKTQSDMRQNAMQTALAAGTQQLTAIKNYADMNPVANQGALAAAYSKVGAPAGITDAITYRAPNPMSAAQQGTMNALKYIDPTAAAATGTPPPNYQAMDPYAMLDRTRYLPQGAAAPAAPAPPATPGWLRADQMNGTAPLGNAMAAPGVAGTVLPGSPQFMGGGPPPGAAPPNWGQPMPNFSTPRMPWDYAPDYSYG